MNNLLSSRLYDNETFYNAFANDLRKARHSIIIESPFITVRRMNGLLPIFHSLRQQGVQIVVNTRNPQEHDEEYQYQASLAIYKMQELGVTVLYTVKHHRKLAIIDQKTLWEGSLNILSQSDSCEIMRRIESEELAKQMVEFVGLDKFL